MYGILVQCDWNLEMTRRSTDFRLCRFRPNVSEDLLPMVPINCFPGRHCAQSRQPAQRALLSGSLPDKGRHSGPRIWERLNWLTGITASNRKISEPPNQSSAAPGA